MTSLALVIAGTIEPTRRSAFDPHGEPLREDAWYWAQMISEPEDGSLVGTAEDPLEPVAPFYIIRSGPVSPLTFRRT